MKIDGSFLHRWRTTGCGWFAAIDYDYRDVTQKPSTPNNRVDTLIRYIGVNLSSQSLTPFYSPVVCCWAANESGTGWWHHLALLLPPARLLLLLLPYRSRSFRSSWCGGGRRFLVSYTREPRLLCAEIFRADYSCGSTAFTPVHSVVFNRAGRRSQCSNWRRQVTTGRLFDLFDVPQLRQTFFPERRTKGRRRRETDR